MIQKLRILFILSMLLYVRLMRKDNDFSAIYYYHFPFQMGEFFQDSAVTAAILE